MGLLVTLARQHGHPFDVLSLKAMHSWAELRMAAKGYDVACMNVRSWRWRWAAKAAEVIKRASPNCQVWAGGFHATVAPQEMLSVPHFDVVVSRQAEGTFLALLDGLVPKGRLVEGDVGKYASLDDLPFVDRGLWPRPPGDAAWPLEGPGGWGPGPRAATMLTARRCPFHCHFCWPAEANHFGHLRRRSVGNVIAELNEIERRWGEFGTVVYHDSEFFMQRHWLEEYLERYPRETRVWPFWASCRSDMVAKWPDLAEALIRDANWHVISLGFESGSDRVLKLLNKGCTVAQHEAAIELVNRIGDDMEAQGKMPPVIFSNVMLAIPGEEPEDAFATLRLMGKVKRNIPSISWYTPYPGSAMGDRLIAEGRSLDSGKQYMRFPSEAKVSGVDYQFYIDLWNGRYDKEIGMPMGRLLMAQGKTGLEKTDGHLSELV